ncbi:MAG: hypothetical protein DYG83_18015 [Candidatus Brocadia sp. AMX2]|nr:MAG: hypothetical protein EDM70_18500 [Candidatus Brocadia sp. AMX2]MBC6934118.1 hypothetical protein [Candidatus Brocadia sp.]MBL1170705.1 hypothetical protein [Candidatus Brocadia sp. AMX1]MCE7868666.1 hypothetical protein [Candidatus Brocadia sp. AMX2]MCQ3919237.1 hypothetical protein [Candidatus Brocadia sp.]
MLVLKRPLVTYYIGINTDKKGRKRKMETSKIKYGIPRIHKIKSKRLKKKSKFVHATLNTA